MSKIKGSTSQQKEYYKKLDKMLGLLVQTNAAYNRISVSPLNFKKDREILLMSKGSIRKGLQLLQDLRNDVLKSLR